MRCRRLPAATGFNPLKVLIPAAVALLVVFAADLRVTRNTTADDANTNQQQYQTLAADPNSQPVQPAQPATGKGEEGITVGRNDHSAGECECESECECGGFAGSAEDFSSVANANANENSNSNSNGNSNRKAPALPEPTRSVVPETAATTSTFSDEATGRETLANRDAVRVFHAKTQRQTQRHKVYLCVFASPLRLCVKPNLAFSSCQTNRVNSSASSISISISIT